MKLKIGHVFAAAETVTRIINEARPLPQKGSYRLARLYAKLKPEYDLIVSRRNAMIEAYGHKERVHQVGANGEPVVFDGNGTALMVEAPNFSVPMDKMPEFSKAWAEVAAEEIEVAVEPIPLDQLDNISAAELIVLDDLVRE